MLLKTLLEGGYIHGECMTVTGKTMRENLRKEIDEFEKDGFLRRFVKAIYGPKKNKDGIFFQNPLRFLLFTT